MGRKYRTPNWQYVRIEDRDRRLFQTILEQKFLRRPEVIEHIFEGKRPYAALRIRKLKAFHYLAAVRMSDKGPEYYLLGPAGVEFMKKYGPEGLPTPRDEIAPGTYKHNTLVTQMRFLFERLRFCADWRSEKAFKKGTGGGKVPDGFFTNDGRGIAVEVETSPKDAGRYREIFNQYDWRAPEVDCVFYISDKLSLMRKVMKLARGITVKPFYFALSSDLMSFRERAPVWTGDSKLRLADFLKEIEGLDEEEA